ncbi:MAG: hypothetical protein ACI4F6_04070 [Acutalibacteraceae bacterium]
MAYIKNGITFKNNIHYAFEKLRKIRIPEKSYPYLNLDPSDVDFQNGINSYSNYRNDFYANMLLKFAYARRAVNSKGITMFDFLANKGGTFKEQPAASFLFPFEKEP